MPLMARASTTAHAMPMTTQPLVCPAPVLTADFDSCSVPGGIELWQNGGYYSPGVCFIGYVALCTQTAAPSGGWPISKDETAVRCVPVGYECNDATADQRYATSLYNDIALSAPAFEIRWRSGDVNGQFTHPSPPPTMPTSSSASATWGSTGQAQSPSSSVSSTPSGTEHEATRNMSAGKMAGIVVAAVCAMGVVLAAVCIMRFRRRKHGFVKTQRNRKTGGETGDAVELDSAGRNPIAELQSEGPAKELDSNRPKQYDDFAAINKEPVELAGYSILGSRSRVGGQD